MKNKDFYSILEVDKNATQEDIKKSYRRLSKKYHPDLNPNDKEAEEKFKELAEAYETLSDNDKRANYDITGTNKTNQNNGYGFNYEDLRNAFRRNRVVRGPDLKLQIKLPLEEIFTGVNKKIKYHRSDNCNTCGGKGGIGKKTCSVCNGSGHVIERYQSSIGYIENITLCNNCEASGFVSENTCKDCNGTGLIQIEEIIEFNVPHGVPDGATMIIDGKGNSIKNGIPGRLIIIIV